MTDLLSAIEANRDAILLGEIGALLHMFGKCSSEFLRYHSVEKEGQDSHQDLKHLSHLESYLRNPKLSSMLSFVLTGQNEELNGDCTDFITKYSRCTRCDGINPTQCPRCKGNSPDSNLMWFFNTCHRMASADEKGVVRVSNTQPKNDMWITTPFGRKVHKLDLHTIDDARDYMDKELAKAFKEFIDDRIALQELRKRAVDILKPGMSQVLGETRQPANDVTLWAQSHGVASLYKPVLATLALGHEPCPRNNGEYDYNNVRWRLFGIGWNGLSFVQQGRRPGDILERHKTLTEISTEIQRILEVEYPIGNLFYADLNGLFFTFPGIDDDPAELLVKELAPELVKFVRDQSDMELWPFFTLSRPRRTLTAITGEIAVRERFASLPKVSTLISLEKELNERTEIPLEDSPILMAPKAGQDICPVCQFRPKEVPSDTCHICQERRSGRQAKWQADRQSQTIWIDEVADRNNRIALLTLRFDLSHWLSGQWLTTLFSQTFNDWYESQRMQELRANKQQRRQLEQISKTLGPTADVVTALLKHIVTGQVTQGIGIKVPVLNTFFEDVEAVQDKAKSNYVVPFLKNLRGRIDDDPNYMLTAEDLASSIFTQNPSPARLARLWDATESFLDAWRDAIETEVFKSRPQRLSFRTTNPVPQLKAGKTYRITVPGLEPGPVTVLCLDVSTLEFMTVDSLEKFSRAQANLSGASVVQDALKERGITKWQDDDTGNEVAGPVEVDSASCILEGYFPFTVLTQSPVFYQVLVPASSTPKALEQLLTIVKNHFGKVEGKLPLYVSLLVSNRRFPLYALLEAGQMALDHHDFKQGFLQRPWWKATGNSDPFYDYYPVKPPSNQTTEGAGFELANLDLVDPNKEFYLTPAYFDFEFLGSTSDRHHLIYESGGDTAQTHRDSIFYGYLRPRPFPLHKLQTVLDIWRILDTCLGSTQKHHLEESLVTKLQEWETVEQAKAKAVFESFGKAQLRHTFGDKWKSLSPEHQRLLEKSLADGLLLETLELFQHVLKEENDG